jgi:hypothetical protein
MKDPTKPLTMVSSEPSNLEEKIRGRAYELYEQRGREDGHEAEDWLRAEEEVKGKQRIAAAA